ncbi:putative Ig domain-containing protein [Caulobacter sp. D4A]|nr:putative Ig domain-containing protein [Caulobacter sp. D4A]
MTFTSVGATQTLNASSCDIFITYAGDSFWTGIHSIQGENGIDYPGEGYSNIYPYPSADTTVTTANATYKFRSNSSYSDASATDIFTVTLMSVNANAPATETLTLYSCPSYGGGATCYATRSVGITVNLNVPPAVSSLSPTSGSTAGGTSVVLTGSNFVNITAVTFGGTNATGYTVNSATQITATAPAGSAGTVNARVTSSTGGQSATAAGNQYTYVAPPTVTSISPTAGPTGGGTSVTITGTNLSGATAVSFGGTAATGFTVNSATQITATAPAGSAGTVDVRVTTAGGQSATSAADQYTYVAAPTVTAVSPTTGSTAGGTSVTITGTNLSGATAVTFGGTAATGYTVNSATQITATAPAGSAGTVDIRVTTVGGQSATSASDQFTYSALPTVTSISPTAGPTGGGTSVTISGTNFTGVTAVTFGATAATGFTFNSATSITATAPAGSAGTVDVRVTTPAGSSATSAADQYTYVSAPTVTSVSPTAGPTGGGQTVTITGTGFAAAAGTGAVKFGAATATYTINSNTQITATSPANSAGTYDITVTTVGGTSATSASDQYTYVAAPTVTSVSPTAGPTGGGTSVTITGTGFAAAAGTGAVKFGAANATYTINSNTQITATSPANSAGTYDITVTTPGGTSATSASDQYTYVAPPVGSSQTYGSIIPYNDGSNATTNIDLSLYITGGGTPTSYAVGSATTAQGGSVSVNSSGIATYTPPVGYRNANDSFTYTASNVGGTSAPATVTVTIGNPTITVTLPASTATVERVYNSGAAAVTFSGGRASYTVNSISGLPSGLTDAGGGVISGTPAVNGVFTVTVNVTDSSLGAGPYNANTTATLTVSLPPAPVVSSFSINGLTYNSGSATATTFSAAPHATESPTGYQVGASSYGATVSVDSAGLMSYTPPVGFRGTDTFNYVATNAGGTSNVGQVFVTVDDPVFSVTLPASTGTVGAVYNSGSSVVTISGGNPPYNNFSATGLPAGLTMDSSGVISGTPTTATTATVVVTVTDSSGGNGSYTSTASANLTIAAPTITLSPASGALPGGQAGVSYSQTFTSTGGVTPTTFAVTAGALPPGLSLSTNGLASGTPTSTGTYNFTVTATDSSGNNYTGSASYSITVSAPTIVVSPSTLPAGAVAAAYSQTITASGGTTPYVFSLDSGTLPAGLTLTTGGVLSGTPTEGGSFPITIKATDATAGGTYSGTQAYTLVIGAPSITLSPASGALAGGLIATAYSDTITASGGTSAYTFQVTAGSLPPGLTLSTGGAISGSPTGGGAYNFTITATDSSTGSGPYTGAAAYSITVASPTITLSPTSLANGAVASAYSASITASGGTTPYSYAVTSGALPAGVTLSTGGALSGTPTAGGTFTFDVTATDSSTGTGAPFAGVRSYSLTVTAPTITVSPSSLASVAVGATVSETITATGGTSGYTYAVTAGALPAGVTLSGDTLSGAPTAAGSFNFTITATDSSTGAGPYTGSRAYTWIVGAPTITVAPTSLSNGQIGAAYSATITASGGTAPYSYAVTSGALPAGVTLSTVGALSGTPTAGGTFTFDVTATDSSTGTGAPFTGVRSYTLTVSAPTITISPTTLGTVVVGTAVSQTITASGGTSGYTFAVTSGALPAGLTLSGDLLSGVPTASGSFNFTITATDSSTGVGPYTGSRVYNVTVGAPTLTMSPANLSAATQHSAYNETITATGGTSPYTYTVTSGALPTGVTLSTGGVLSGTPTVTGTFNITIRATDSTTGSGPYIVETAYSLAVNVPAPPTSGAVSTTVAANSSDNTVTPALSGVPATSVAVATAPAHGTATVSGMTFLYTPTAGYSGVDSFTYTASNAGGPSAPATVSITVTAPTLVVAGTPTGGTVAVAYTDATFTATTGTAPYTFAGASLPAGLALSTAGVLSGTPTAAGTFNAVITATDAYGATGSASFPITIAAPTVTITSPTAGALPTATAFVAYSQTFAATGGVAPRTFAVTAGALPPGLTLSTTGVLSGSATATGSYNFSITPSDGSGSPGPYAGTPSAYSLTVGAPAMTLSPASVPNGTVTVPYTATFSAAGGTSPYTYLVTAGALPMGLTLSSAGVISGAAVQAASGSFTFTVTATDANGFTVSGAYGLTMAQVTLVTGTPSSGVGGQAYGEALSTTGGTGPYTYALTAGALPAGITLSAAGQLSGTPTVAGTFPLTITATDVNGATGDTVVNLVIAAPTITLPPRPLDGTATVPYSSTLGATGGATPYSYAVTAGALPTGLTLASNGVISGVVPQSAVGTYNFTVTATDANGFTGSAPFTSTIAQVTLSLSLANDMVEAGQPYNAPVSTIGGTGPYTYSMTGGALPPGVSFSAGVFSGVPTASGTYNVNVTSTDSYGAVGTGSLQIDVLDAVLDLTPTSLSPVPYGIAFSQAFQTTGGVAPYSYTVTGALPAGVSFSAAGVLSGTPTEAGSFPLQIRVTDTTGGRGPYSQRYDMTLVVEEAPPPVVEPTNTTTPAGSPTTIDVSNLIDGFYDSVIIVDPPQHGTATVTGSASRMRSQGSGTVQIIYTPNPGYYGQDSFTYAATGPGGTSSPAAISVAVAAPAPVVVDDTASLAANATVNIAVTANDTGPISTIAIATAPSHGTATVSGLTVNYAPATNFFGTDTFTYTATGEGGTGGPATVTVTVTPLATPTQTAQVITVLAGQSTTLAATQGATGSPFTSVTVATAPTKGTATINGLNIVYTPATGFSGADAFTYRINNPFGASDPVPVTVTVNPAPLTAPPITVEILAGQKAVVNLVTNASGGPFIGAAVVAITPANSGAAVITNPSTGAYTLTFTPDNAFAGTAVVTYTLSNAFATSAPGRINVIVTARPDPSQDPEVKGLVAAQDAAAIRFADAQISNFNRRLEQLHNGGGAGRGFGVSVRGGNTEREDGLEARERFRKYASLGMNDAADPSSPLLPAASSADAAPGNDGEDGQAGPKRWGVWAAGSADFGMRDTVGSQSGFRFTTDGLTAGADYRVNGQFAFGVGFGYGRDSSRVGKNGTKSRAESYSAGLYASLQPSEKTFVDGVIGLGSLDFDTRRYVTTTGELVNGQRDGDQVFAALTFGVEHRTPTSLLSPYGRVAYSRSVLDAFSEDGGGPYGLTYHSQTVRSLTGTLGLRGEFARKTAAGLLAPRFRVEYSHDFEKANDALLSYTDWVGGPTYRLAVDPIDRDQLRLELGADLTVKSGWKIGLDFDNSVSKDSDSQGVRLSVQSPF